jgi:glycosyltransferase involved in cell wall biosynthesis
MSGTGPLVTIGIPTFNRAHSHLRGCIESALGQTYGLLDVLVADNHSVDDTAGLVSSYRDPRLRYARHPRNTGANANANFCLQDAHGEWFLLLHDDDLIDPDFVEVCLSAARGKEQAGIIRTGTRVIGGDGSMVTETPNLVGGLPMDEFILGYLRGRTAFYCCSTLFRTSALRDAGGLHSKHNLVDDGVAILRLAAQHGRADVADVKASFRQHAGKLGRTMRIADWCDDSLFLLNLMEELAGPKAAAVRREGLPYFARANYRRALRSASWSQRLSGQLIVWRKFGGRYLPPFISDRLVARGARRLAGSVSSLGRRRLPI